MSKKRLLAILSLASTLAVVRAQFVCPAEGLWADPDNCRQFYSCFYHIVDGTPTLHGEGMTCGETELFQETGKYCDHDYNVFCGDRPMPDGSTGHTGLPSQPPTTTTTTTTVPGQTTTTRQPSPPLRFPDKVVGMYLAMADNTVPGFGTDADWDPRLYPYQIDGANVLFFSFIHPGDMIVPMAFQRLAASRGTGADGAVPAETVIMFAIGGFLYSQDPNPWPWLLSQAAAEAMADEVATWPDRYGCDGIDMDIEEGAGFHPDAGPNLVHFMRRLRQLKPDIIIGQPTYGYPQVDAANVVINNSWRVGGTSQNLADSIGIMVYEGTLSLDYVDDYARGSQQWEGYPITVDVPTQAILVGCKGSAIGGDIMTLANESISQDLLGIMVWYASVRNGFLFAADWDASNFPQSQAAYVAAMSLFGSSK